MAHWYIGHNSKGPVAFTTTQPARLMKVPGPYTTKEAAEAAMMLHYTCGSAEFPHRYDDDTASCLRCGRTL